ncbi:MAG: hypothetical protein ACI9SB_002736, partial [Candidatus Azotimanducaceae bacterium]
MKKLPVLIASLLLLSTSVPVFAANNDALFASVKDEVPRRQHGDGQYDQLIIRGAYLIDGTGAPATGPVDVVVERDRIVEVRAVGTPGIEIDPENRPALLTDSSQQVREIDAHGKYLLPGFIDSHSHIHSLDSAQGVSADYIFKLWMGHGITSVREVFASSGETQLMTMKTLSDENVITAPRITAFPFFSLRKDGDKKLAPINTPDDARRRVRDLKKLGADGIKFMGAREEILWAALQEAEKVGLRTTMHHAQLDVIHANVLDTSSRGLDCMEHWYGLPEALFTDRVIQDYPSDYIYSNEQDRFGQAGRLW